MKLTSSFFSFVLLVVGSCFCIEGIAKRAAWSNPSFLEFRWEDTGPYKKLYFTQSASGRREKSTYYLVLKGNNRRTGILKLTINLPKYFDSTVKVNKLNLCKVQVGSMVTKTKCKETIPAVFEVTQGKKGTKTIEVFPNNPIPSDKDSYAVVMKIFNPSGNGMYQMNAIAQSPGKLPVSTYIGSWSIDIR